MVYNKTTSNGVSALAQSSHMSEHLVRVGRLKELQKLRSWDDAELARQCGRQPQQLNAWWTNKRMIGEKLARSLEANLKLPRYYLDERSAGSTPTFMGVSEGTPLYDRLSGYVTKAVRPVPVLAWDQLTTMLAMPIDEVPKRTPRLETHAVSSSLAKFVQMHDDSMTPTFQPGDHVLFDPQEAPHAGDTVLVRIETGEHLVRTFTPKSAQVFEAVAMNKDYMPISSADDGAVVVAVMIEHRRYRRHRA